MEKILILTDYTPTCYDSVTYGLDFCRYYGFGAEILHIEEEDEDINVHERMRVMELASLYRGKMQGRVDVVTRGGDFSSVISEMSDSGGYTLIVMGTHGRSGFQSLTGSAAARVITSQDLPVIVVQSKRFSPVRVALLPVADSVGQYSGEIEKMAAITRMMGADVRLVCRRGEEYHAGEISDLFGRVLPVDLSVDYCKDRTFSLQAIEHGEKIGADMFLGFSHEISRPTFAPTLEQLMFNLALIPVMCC